MKIIDITFTKYECETLSRALGAYAQYLRDSSKHDNNRLSHGVLGAKYDEFAEMFARKAGAAK